jgi:hypothetical protein
MIQEDIDRVIGNVCLPTLAERPHLPLVVPFHHYLIPRLTDFTSKVFVMRCANLISHSHDLSSDDLPHLAASMKSCDTFGAFHYLTEVDEYGYQIPKGTTVIPNVWAVFHGPETYPDPMPMTFKIDRSLVTLEQASTTRRIQYSALVGGKTALTAGALSPTRLSCSSKGRRLVNLSVWTSFGSPCYWQAVKLLMRTTRSSNLRSNALFLSHVYTIMNTTTVSEECFQGETKTVTNIRLPQAN